MDCCQFLIRNQTHKEPLETDKKEQINYHKATKNFTLPKERSGFLLLASRR